MRQSKGWKSMVCLVVCACFLSACATVSDDDQTNTKAQGAILGAVLGAAVGQALGGDTKATLIGTAVGAVAGGIAGNEVAKRKAEYKNREDMIAKETERTEQFISELEVFNEQLREELAAHKEEIDRLRARIEAGVEDRDAKIAQTEKLIKRKAEVEQALKASEEELQMARKMLAEAQAEKDSKEEDLSNWIAKVDELEDAKNELQAYLGELTAMTDTVTAW